jgi:tRNA-dihydrouridine synthase 3
MGPMTKGSNLPYRRLCVELGARITTSEMTVVRRLRQRRKGEFALIRRFDGEPCFGVQLASTNPDELAWAAALVESRGADFVDLNCGCPIDHFTHKGLGASLGRQPSRQRRLVEAMKKAATRVPVTAKIRLGWSDEMRNYLDQARALVDGGADALAVHGRTRNARYRTRADWEAISEIAAAVAVPVVGNGDLLYGHDAAALRARTGCAAVMTARAALIRPWVFRESTEGYRDVSAEERVVVYRRYVALAKSHWGDDAHGLERVRTFTRWHLDFWCRDVRRREDGSYPTMQVREASVDPRSPLEALLSRADGPALDYVCDCLVSEREIDPNASPAPAGPASGGEDSRLVAVEG